MSQPRKGVPQPATSPWNQSFTDYMGRAVSISVIFDEGTRELTSGSVTRDEGCLFTHILIGIGPDGTPDSTPFKFFVPVGTTDITADDFANVGLTTIEQITALQITAGL